MQVAIDTSTEIASLALVREGIVLAEITWHSGQNHTVQLLPNLASLFELTGTSAGQLTGVIVAKGPGSFNGLRVGVSIAKGIAFSRDIPIVGINSLEVAAWQYAGMGLPVCPVFGAGRSEIAAALYRQHDGQWEQIAPERITTPEQLAAEITEKTVFCGDYVRQNQDKIRGLLAEKAVIISPGTDLRRAAYLAELGNRRLAEGAADNVTTLQPIYLRRPSITKAKHL